MSNDNLAVSPTVWNNGRVPGEMTDAEWCDLILSSLREPVSLANGITLPGYPAEEIQKLTTSAGATEGMMRGGFAFYRRLKEFLATIDQPLNSESSLLDFGCGWGRITRFFLKELPIENLHGVEVMPDLVSACRDNFGTDNFHLTTQNKGLSFNAETFDFVIANSVFSHLNQELNLHWIKEIGRVMKPGGIAALTIIDPGVFETMASNSSSWFNSLGIDVTRTLNKLDKGEFIWATTKRKGELKGYGLSAIPMSWIETNWTQHFELLGSDGNYSQRIVFLRKPA